MLTNYNDMWNLCFTRVFVILIYVLSGGDCLHLGMDFGFLLDHFHISQPGNFCHPQPPTKTSHIPLHSDCNSNTKGIFSNVPSVCIFTNTLNKVIDKSHVLSKVFDLSETTAKQYSQYLYEFNFNLYKRFGEEIANSIAEFVSRAVGLYFDKITKSLVMSTLSGTAANFLLVEGILNVNNAKKLAIDYSNNIEKHAKFQLTEDPTSKFQVLADSFFDYMGTVDKNLKMTAPISTYFYGIGWFMSAVDSGCFKP